MIKRTLYFGNPCYLSTKDEQLVLELPNPASLPKADVTKTVPIEDIGVVILDHQQITISQALMYKLLHNNVAMITCDNTHHPVGLMLNLEGNTLQSQKFKDQVDASVPIKKQLWQQTIKAKLQNQASHLETYGIEAKPMRFWASEIQSGDAGGHEGRAAAFYWKNLSDIFYNQEQKQFFRKRDGEPPNNILNYAYAILRATVARGLVGSGLLPTLGIHHRNQYNAYCLADDIMEPYRPIIDKLVVTTWLNHHKPEELTPQIKKELLIIPAMDINIGGQKSPLMIGLQRTTASLAACFEGSQRKIIYPEM
ncbi:MAG: type II CRISPR-associated endonuclease Cas1 [Bacteroidota bacterium]